MTRRGTCGFSVTEVVLAVGIVAAFSAPIIGSMVSSRIGLEESLDEVTATAEAVRTLEALKRLPFDDVPVSRDGEIVAEADWASDRFSMEQRASAGGPSRPAGAVLAALGPAPSRQGMKRALGVSLVPTGQHVMLKMVDVRVCWPRASVASGSESCVSLCTVLGPPGGLER